MEAKDWILLFVPILSNGVIIFIFQKIYEQRQLSIMELHKYVSILLQKVDNALSKFINIMESINFGTDQVQSFSQFIGSYREVVFYYQQNKGLLKSFEKDINRIAIIHDQIDSIPRDENYLINILPHLESVFKILQSIQTNCIKR